MGSLRRRPFQCFLFCVFPEEDPEEVDQEDKSVPSFKFYSIVAPQSSQHRSVWRRSSFFIFSRSQVFVRKLKNSEFQLQRKTSIGGSEKSSHHTRGEETLQSHHSAPFGGSPGNLEIFGKGINYLHGLEDLIWKILEQLRAIWDISPSLHSWKKWDYLPNPLSICSRRSFDLFDSV